MVSEYNRGNKVAFNKVQPSDLILTDTPLFDQVHRVGTRRIFVLRAVRVPVARRLNESWKELTPPRVHLNTFSSGGTSCDRGHVPPFFLFPFLPLSHLFSSFASHLLRSRCIRKLV